ncbi:MAG: anion permease [Syntrophorhabdaceae bacterium]|nr:anion permease [Syntrophorhabdaceae bacterium]
MKNKLKNSLITIAIGLMIWFIPVPKGVTSQAWHLLAIFAATIVGFILQPLPIGAIAFISLTITATLKVLTPHEALAGFGDDTIWLIVSAFLFAKGFIKTGLGRRIAYRIMGAIGDSSLKLAYALVFSDLVISPATPSNTARAGGILYPIVRSLASAFDSEPGKDPRRIGAYLIKTVFQGNCITSAMFLTAVAPNSIVASMALQTANIQLGWGTWALAALLPGLIGIAFTPWLLYRLYPPEIKKTPEAKEIARAELTKMGPISRGEILVAGVFLLALLLWTTSSITGLSATVTAMIAVGIMLIGGAITWQDVLEEKGAWDTLVWMGTLISLASALTHLGLIKWFADLVAAKLTGIHWMIALILLLLAYMYSHYAFASLSAHVTAMYAAFLAVAIGEGAPPFLSAMGLGVISSLFGCLTHFATGPAPIYFGSGYVPQGTWWRLGFIMSVVNLIIFIGIGGLWWKMIGLW